MNELIKVRERERPSPLSNASTKESTNERAYERAIFGVLGDVLWR